VLFVKRYLAVLLALGTLGSPVEAQLQPQPTPEGFGSECAPQGTLVRQYCERLAEAIQIVQPRAGIAVSGGNPVPGTASTMGMRIGTAPRINIGVRATAAAVEIAGIETLTDEEDMTFAIPSVNVDAGVGLFSGFGLGPTVGGLGSIDLLGSIGTIPLPGGEGFESSPISWAAGARIGVLRESFTAPGISVSAMYRQLGEVEYGDTIAGERDAYFQMDDLTAWSLRGTISKRLLGIGLTAGAGYDRYSSAVQLIVDDPTLLGGKFRMGTDQLESSRTTLFGNVSLTMLILHLVGEVGWQGGGDPDWSGQTQTDQLDNTGIYGSVALRLTL
jgi:hypothetical protein